MKYYYHGFNQALRDMEKQAAPLWLQFLSPTQAALAARIGTGAALGGGLGYLTGEEQRDWLGRPIGSTRGRNALIGALLGGATLGASPRVAEEILVNRLSRGGNLTRATEWAARRQNLRTNLSKLYKGLQEDIVKQQQAGLTGDALTSYMEQQAKNVLEPRKQRLFAQYYAPFTTAPVAAPAAAAAAPVASAAPAAAAAPVASAAASTPQKRSLIQRVLSRTKARLTNLFSRRKSAQ
jgi:hypothetical protein